ncbi:MAG: VOC family protein [Lysobacterales bacterium]
MTRLVFFLIICCLTCSPAHSDSLVRAGYQEVVFSVSSIADYQSFLTEVAGWEVLSDRPVTGAQLKLWQLPAHATARQLVMGNPGTERGFIRLVQFSGVEQEQIRSNAQSWDTGGWFDVNARVLDMDLKFDQFQSRGWQAGSDPVEFVFGPFTVQEWLARGPDGIVMALIERVQPPLEGWPKLKQISRVFNATQIVPDIDQARVFYQDKLGFQSYLEHNGASAKAGPNVLGMPYNLATEVTRIVSIVSPNGTNEGSVELLQFDGLSGADWSARAVPPNLGILMLRFPVTSMDQFYAHAQAEQLDVISPPMRVDVPPYGLVSLMSVRGPGGVWLEFYELENAEGLPALSGGQ